jgi:hypothetical protein
MKTLAARGLVALCLSGTVAFIFAGEFHSVIITTSPLMINVNDDHSLRIWNFTQEGGTQRGVVTVTINGQTVNVLTASIIDTGVSPTPSPLEIVNQVVIAGPAQVAVAPVSGATLFITYRKQLDESSGTPSSTATPTATPTPTPTPTP